MPLRWIAGLAAGLLWFAGFAGIAQAADDAPLPRYMTSKACAACHESETAGWRRSHHALAWLSPSAGSVLGDFEAPPFEHGGSITRFYKDGASFHISTDEQDGTVSDFEVVGTVGIAPLQQYLVETEPGRLQALDLAWDAADRRWYHLYPDLDLPAGDGLHWTGPYKNWNARCAECHATGFVKNYDPQSRTYASRQVETGIGCEACHGPGEAHVAWADDPSNFAGTRWPGTDAMGLVHRFPRGEPEAEIQQCAGCHSRREPLGDGNPLPGTAFHDAYRLALLRDGLYHADGQILDEVYVYGSFLQSRMYERGVRCSNCHDPHSGAPRAADNALCTQCHSPAGNPDFPSLTPKVYDAPAHHFHEPGSTGAECKSCHMIERVYMGIDGRRDHSFRVPRPDLSVALATPNACNDCHDDRSAEWAADAVASWYPDSSRRGAPVASTFAAAWRGAGGARTAARLVEVALSRDLSGIVRASALAALMPYASPEVADLTKALLRDEDPLLRMAAVALQRQVPTGLRLRRVAPLLEDPVKAVRIAAVRGLLDLLAGGYAPPAAGPAMQEYSEALAAKADFPETQMALAGTALTFRQFAEAESAFAEAVRMDPQLIDAWVMIARLRAAQGDGDGAAAALRQALTANPESAPLRQALQDLGVPLGQQ